MLVTLLSISLRVMVLVVSVDGFVAAVRDHGGVAQVMEMNCNRAVIFSHRLLC